MFSWLDLAFVSRPDLPQTGMKTAEPGRSHA
jgi:hypothetical protein